MKTIIAGGRNYTLTEEDYKKLEGLGITEIINGGASGADLGGVKFAKKHNLPITYKYPDWKKYGKAAGPLRNREMAEIAEAVVLFPGGKGTESMYYEAKKKNLKIYDWRNG